MSWSHYVQLLSIKDLDEIIYYVNLAVVQSLDVRTLRDKIKSKDYQRIDDAIKLKMKNNEKLSIKDLIPNPINIRNNNGYKVITEKILQKIILEDIVYFLKELGDGFTFIENEYKFKLGDSYNYIDLLLYNIRYKCYVVIELKITELKKEHVGQIQLYMNYIDKHLKMIDENKTIGIIICKQNNKYVIEYSSDERILARVYEFL